MCAFILFDYNRYIYKGNYWLSRKQINQYNPEILEIFKWIGALYLIYLAVNFLRRTNDVTIGKISNTRSTFDLFKDGFISALFSPGAIVFFLVIFPTFLDPNNNNFMIHFIILMITHVFLDFFFLTIYAGISSRIAIFLKNYPNLISRLSGCALLFIAYKILSTKINL